MKPQDFIDKVKAGAITAYKTWHILPSLTIAQAALESGWGRSPIGNNLFGIKAGSTWKGAKKLVTTQEFVDGKYITIQAWFRDYSSWDASVVDHALLLTSDRYKPVRAAKDYKEACKQIKACGYATSPTYTENLIKIIEQYKLYQYDNPEPTCYIVSKGDTLAKIAAKYHTTVTKLAADNGIKDVNVISLGQKLVIK